MDINKLKEVKENNMNINSSCLKRNSVYCCFLCFYLYFLQYPILFLIWACNCTSLLQSQTMEKRLLISLFELFEVLHLLQVFSSANSTKV